MVLGRQFFEVASDVTAHEPTAPFNSVVSSIRHTLTLRCPGTIS
jgi:hypothetical protein